MKKEIAEKLEDVKAHLKEGGTYYDTLVEAACKAVIDALTRSAVNVDIDIVKAVGYDAAKQFLNHWIGGQDAEVPDVDPNNPQQRDVDGVPAAILHPSKEDDHKIPASVKKHAGVIPPPHPGVPEAFTPEEEANSRLQTSRPKDEELQKDLKEKSVVDKPELASKKK